MSAKITTLIATLGLSVNAVSADWIDVDHEVFKLKKSISDTLVSVDVSTYTEHSLKSISELLIDTDKICSYTDSCSDLKVVGKTTRNDYLLQITLDTPFPVQNRESYTRSLSNFTSENQFRLEFTSENLADIAVRNEALRLPHVSGVWIINDLGSKREIIYRSTVDLGGSVPMFITNITAVDAPVNTLSNFLHTLDK